MIRKTALALTLALGLLAAAPVAVFAGGGKQAAEGQGHGPGAMMITAIENAAAAEPVKLDAEQKTKVHGVLEDAMAQLKAMQEDRKATKGDAKSPADRQANREKMMSLAQATVEKVEAFLTEEQKPAFRTALQSERAKLRAERGDRRGDRNGVRGDKGPTTQRA